jgi:WD40 repeat protein
VTASEDGTAKLWDVQSGACRRTIDTSSGTAAGEIALRNTGTVMLNPLW